jgi:mannan endo-1,4-beta-mannosidase
MKLTDSLSFLLFLVSFLFAGCGKDIASPIPDLTLVDLNATPETKALFINLDRIRRENILFGHEDALAYGVHWRNDEPGRSDVVEVTGSYPAVYGWEIGDLELGKPENLDNVNFDKMREWIREGYERGGIITISWHMNNPATGGNAWDVGGDHGAVRKVLPGGELHDLLREWLDSFAEFAGSLIAYPGTDAEHLIPVIFRPYHEHTGSWFWWGADHCTPEEYNRLWRFTVEYLRDEKSVHHLLWALSPAGDAAASEAAYLKRYPGDQYVDIVGFDDYGSVREPYQLERFKSRLRFIVNFAEVRGKIPALTETGYEAIPDPEWWTGTLLAALNHDSVTRRIAWVLVWRNSNNATDRQNHFYAPYPGHPSAGDFIEFRNHPLILFEDDLPDMYRFP